MEGLNFYAKQFGFYMYVLLMTKKDEGLRIGPCYVNIQSGLCRPGVCSVGGVV